MIAALIPALLSIASAGETPEDARLGFAFMGGAVLTSKDDTSSSSGPLRQRLQLGRTPIVGLAAWFPLGHRLQSSAELTYGPYRGNRAASCIDIPPGSCHGLRETVVVRSSLEYSHQLLLFAGGPRRGYLGLGVGGRTYFVRFPPHVTDHSTHLGPSLALGLEIPVRRRTARVEARGVRVFNGPVLGNGRPEYELQIRAAITLNRTRPRGGFD